MKNFSILILGFITIISSCIPPSGSKHTSNSSNPFKGKYTEFLEPGSTVLSEGYNFTVEKTKENFFVEKIYNPDLRVMNFSKTFSDKELRSQNGLSKAWWDDGDLISEGYYETNTKTGEWKECNGKYCSVGAYVLDKKDGVWITQDSAGNKIREYNYFDGKKNGEFQIWAKDGRLAKRGIYKNGKKESQEVIIKKRKRDINSPDPVEIMALYKHPDCKEITDKKAKKSCADRKMLEFIYKNIKYPAVARENGVQGMAVIQFTIDKDGTIINMKTRRGICKEIQAECERIVSKMGKWEPGFQRGKAVKVQFNLPVNFKLE